jgi:protoporphyrinogen oxidase/predicted dehydrogenase
VIRSTQLDVKRVARSKRLRIAVVGLGYWGPNLVRVLNDMPHADVTALWDVRSETRKAAHKRFPNIREAASFQALLDDTTVDAIAIATPVSSHFELADAALAAGKHVFVEKPLASSAREALLLIERAEERDLVLMPGHTFLYSPPVVKVKELIEAGELGEIYFVSTSRVNLGLHQPDASVVWDLAPHDFSILRYWLDEMPQEVAALSRACVVPSTPDVAFINLTFPSGTVAHVELSWLAPSKLRRTAVVGSHKMVVYDDTSTEPVRIFDSGADLPDPESFGEYRLTYRTGAVVSPKIEPSEPLALELEEFCAAALDGRPLRSSPSLGLEVVRMIEAVDRSLENGGMPVRVDVGSVTLADELVARVSGPQGLAGELRDARHERPDPPAASEGAMPSIGTAVLGGGPAGLTAAYVLGLRGRNATLFEAEASVGGLAKTVELDGFRFDLGGHRFFTKLEPIERIWEEMLGEDFLTRPRLSRIYYNGKYFSYPLRAKDVLDRLGIVESARSALSYLWSLRQRKREAKTFEEWVTSRFGRRLYNSFFRTYTEKVWGIPGSQIQAQWAAQRIKNFSFANAFLSILGLRRENVTTLIEEFRYPRLGPGQMWEQFQHRVETLGIPVRLKHSSVAVRHDGQRVHSVVVATNGDREEYEVDAVISSIPLSALVLSMEPAAPPEVLAAARRLRYRDLCLVALMTSEMQPFDDNWIYLHDPGTRAGRVQNYAAWSPDMVPPGTTCLGVEYFCFEGDDIWRMSSEEAVELAKNELAAIGLIDPNLVFDGAKVLVPQAYPMYDERFEEAVEVLRAYVEGFENLKTCGRNGLHRYNNQDHSMWTAVLTAVNLLDGTDYDGWSVNTEADYHEEGKVVDAALHDTITGALSQRAPTHTSIASSSALSDPVPRGLPTYKD